MPLAHKGRPQIFRSLVVAGVQPTTGDYGLLGGRMPARQDLLVFVDWNSQVSNGGQRGEMRPRQRAEKVANFIADALSKAIPTDRGVLYRASIRVYYGWHRGLTATDARHALAHLARDNLLPLTRGAMAFDWSNMFGDTLLDAFDHRKHARVNVHLPDTLRANVQAGGEEREKMVDTAMACDILCSARSEPFVWRVAMAEDDDVVPSIFVAEKWSKERGGRNYILRDRSDSGHLNLNGILLKLDRAK